VGSKANLVKIREYNREVEEDMIDFKEKANLIWAVADLLRGDYKQADYGKIILPMTVLRRLDSVLDLR
jgi:type I restriction enzyme M protein